MHQMLIRRAKSEDAELVESTRVAAWKSAYRIFMPSAFLESLDPAANVDKLRAALHAKPPPFLMSVAEIQGRVVAFAILGKPRYPASEGTAELWALNVHPQHWREGMGQRLVARALAEARNQGCTTVELWCIQGNEAACHLYEACGFTPDGRRRSTTGLTGQPLHEVAYRRAL